MKTEKIPQHLSSRTIDSSPKTHHDSLFADNRSQSVSQAKMVDVIESANSRPTFNNTGMPDNLKTGIESISGISMDAVRVHYNSPKPAQLLSLAYTQGTDIHIAAGQERYLPHEAWHVVQQMQGRVSPNMQMAGVNVNNDPSLEAEASYMGAQAVQMYRNPYVLSPNVMFVNGTTVQMAGLGWILGSLVAAIAPIFTGHFMKDRPVDAHTGAASGGIDVFNSGTGMIKSIVDMSRPQYIVADKDITVSHANGAIKKDNETQYSVAVDGQIANIGQYTQEQHPVRSSIVSDIVFPFCTVVGGLFGAAGSLGATWFSEKVMSAISSWGYVLGNIETTSETAKLIVDTCWKVFQKCRSTPTIEPVTAATPTLESSDSSATSAPSSDYHDPL